MVNQYHPNFAEGELWVDASVKRLVFSHDNLRGTFAAQGKTVTTRRLA
jgi:hypothetical protein